MQSKKVLYIFLATVTLIIISVAIFLSTKTSDEEPIIQTTTNLPTTPKLPETNDAFNKTETILEIEQGQIKCIKYFPTNTITCYKLGYALPPVGDLRLEPPIFENLPKFDGIYDATKRGNRCLQRNLDYSDLYTYSEDCLYLSVTLPANIDDNLANPKNVLVYIHGGSYQVGDGQRYNTDSSLLVQQENVIVVSITYRMAYLGFAAFKGTFLGKETIGNYGLMDQYAALQWIQRNIKYFGGDPKKVTVFGDSAGGESTMAQVLWEDSKINNNIISAIPISWPVLAYHHKEQADDLNKKLARKFDCLRKTGGKIGLENYKIDKDCVKRMDGLALIQTFVLPTTPVFDFFTELLPSNRNGKTLDPLTTAVQLWAPTIDGTIVKGQPIDQYKSLSNENKIPPILGIVAEGEGVSMAGYVPFDGEELTEFAFKAFLKLGFESIYNETYDLYWQSHGENVTDHRLEAADLITDYLFHCSVRNLLSRNSSNNTNYLMYWKRPWVTSINGEDEPGNLNSMKCKNRACHAQEIKWIFGVTSELDFYYNNKGDSWDEHLKNKMPDGPAVYQADKDGEKMIRSLMADFARDPNNLKDLEKWSLKPVSKDNGYSAYNFGANGELYVSENYRREYCDFWDGIDRYSEF